jgi:predicted transcriptional regulator
MQSQKLKEYLYQIANQVDDSTTLEDVYKELALLADIEESEAQEAKGEVYTQTEVENMAKKWLK